MANYEKKLLREAKELGIELPEGILKHIKEYEDERENMVQLIVERGIKSERVIFAMRVIPRHIFVPEDIKHLAYSDNPLPIGFGQTISQPYITALMTEELEISGGEKILEIGTGSGYHTSILALLGGEVLTIEYEEKLSREAERKLKELGFKNIKFVVGDGSEGFPKFAPYDRISVSAAAPDIPPPLLEQLKVDGIMVIPIGDEEEQVLCKIIKYIDGSEFSKKEICPCRFVKMRGKFGFR